MIRLQWILFYYNTVEPWVDSLIDLGAYNVHIHWYNRTVPSDQGILDAVERFKPDLIVYTGTAGGVEIPSPSTLAKIRKQAPSVFLSGDVGDPPWWPYIDEYRRNKCFDLYVNFDGNDNWPKQGNDYTCLSPNSPRHFSKQKPLKERPIPFGFAGSFAWHDAKDPRRLVLDRLRQDGLTIKTHERDFGTYKRFSRFLTSVQLTPNMPFSGSGFVSQVKGRTIEGALAGCCLLDHVSSAACHWFEAGVDFAVYKTPDEAAEIAKFLLTKPDKMQDMASRLKKRVLTEHAPSDFWKRLTDTALS